MQDEYKKPYGILFNGITDALAALEEHNFEQAKACLIKAQQMAEEAFISGYEDVGNREEP